MIITCNCTDITHKYLLLVSVQNANCGVKHKHLWTVPVPECSKWTRTTTDYLENNSSTRTTTRSMTRS